jgi:DNA helicase-2/ATP-dependent DNA helicase PcrA
VKFLIPIAIAHTEGRQLEVMRLIREYSPLLEKDTLAGANVAERLRVLRELVASIAEGIAGNSSVTIGDLLKQVYAAGLLILDPRLASYLIQKQLHLPRPQKKKMTTAKKTMSPIRK